MKDQTTILDIMYADHRWTDPLGWKEKGLPHPMAYHKIWGLTNPRTVRVTTKRLLRDSKEWEYHTQDVELQPMYHASTGWFYGSDVEHRKDL